MRNYWNVAAIVAFFVGVCFLVAFINHLLFLFQPGGWAAFSTWLEILIIGCITTGIFNGFYNCYCFMYYTHGKVMSSSSRFFFSVIKRMSIFLTFFLTILFFLALISLADSTLRGAYELLAILYIAVLFVAQIFLLVSQFKFIPYIKEIDAARTKKMIDEIGNG